MSPITVVVRHVFGAGQVRIRILAMVCTSNTHWYWFGTGLTSHCAHDFKRSGTILAFWTRKQNNLMKVAESCSEQCSFETELARSPGLWLFAILFDTL